MVRVKRTGEQCEVSKETFRILRAEEKRLRRSYVGTPIAEEEENTCPILSLDTISEDDVKDASWLADPQNLESNVLAEMFIEEFCRTLSPIQAIFFRECILNGQNYRAFSRKYHIGKTTTWRWQKEIREKIKKFFSF